ncbi:MAG: carbohydrate kinase [Planctomycetes bacterium]|nr:carbohydrate kinase [Planctomycetota bacterium]
MNIISVGEVLWDVFQEAEHIGGAVFNCSAHAARLGHSVTFISAVGNDDRGKRALQRARELRLSTSCIRVDPEHPTGHVSVWIDAAGQPSFTIHRPAAYDFPELTPDQERALGDARADWLVFGTLAQMSPAVRAATRAAVRTSSRARRLYDINLRKDSFEPGLVRELLGLASILKINEEEVEMVRSLYGEPHTSFEAFCDEYLRRYGLEGICVTRGARGCAVRLRECYLEAPGYPVQVADTVGAGDAFAAAFIHGLGQGWSVAEVADFANRVGALVASRTGAVPDWTIAEARALTR